MLPRPYQVHGFGPRCRHGLARSRLSQDGPCDARRNQPAGIFSRFVTPSHLWLLPSPNTRMRRAPILQVLSVATLPSLSAATSATVPTRLRTPRRRSNCGSFLLSCSARTMLIGIVPYFLFSTAGSRRASFSTRPRSPPGSSSRREVLEHHIGSMFLHAATV